MVDDDVTERDDDELDDDDDWEPDLRPLPEKLNGAARRALEWHMARWQAGERITPSDLLPRAEEFLRKFPGDVRFYEDDVNLQAMVNVITTYDIMGWVEVEMAGDGTPVVVGVTPGFKRQTFDRRSESISRRYDADRTRKSMSEQEAEYGEAVKMMGLSTDEDFDTLLAKLRPHGLALKLQPVWGLHLCFVVVWNPKTGQMFRGQGYSESEALCYAAAQAFLASAGEVQA